jgi:S1/P1 Nuclease
VRSATQFVVLVVIFTATAFGTIAQAYGPLGHEIVGAVADERLANTPTAAKIHGFLDGLTLEKAAGIPDEIKAWDANGADDPSSFHYSAHRRIDEQLRDFWRANPPMRDRNPGVPSHHWFHYTDVPVKPPQKYRNGKVGRGRWDVVHMIPYCIQVLQGRVSEQNERKITKAVAIILLAHLVADIHQPLHVGAEYFDAQGRPTDPARNKSALADEGGNTFRLELSDEPRSHGIDMKNLHGFWDYDAVNALFPGLAQTLDQNELEARVRPLKKQLVHEMATHEPQSWRIPVNIDIANYAEAWANEILPIAREAHERLQLKNVHPEHDQGRIVAAGEADEKRQPDGLSYRAWAAAVAREELHKAGWRLADLLERVLR